MCCYVCLRSDFLKPDLISFPACITPLSPLSQWLTILSQQQIKPTFGQRWQRFWTKMHL